MPNEPTTILLGKLLAEVYRLQKAAGLDAPDAARIFALRNGFESAIQDELAHIGFISTVQLQHAISVLEPYWKDPAKLASLKGFYDIEQALADGGVDRDHAKQIFQYLQANSQFTDVLAKMDSTDSPLECRTFTLSKWDV